jgi:hypothetical protein
VKRLRTLLPTVALVVAVVAALPSGTGAQALVGAQPKLMVLTARDVGHVSYIKGEGATTEGPIAASRGYRRTFSGFTPGSVQLLTVEDTVLIGKSPAAAAKWIASFVRTTSSKGGLDKLSAQTAKDYGASIQERITKGSVMRARELKAGDGAAEVVFRFTTSEATVVQVGQIFVRVGGNLSAIHFDGAMPGLSPEATKELALAAALRMRQGASGG